MDANGLRFWMIASAHQWRTASLHPDSGPAHTEYDQEHHGLRLASERNLASVSAREPNESNAFAALQMPPETEDGVGNRAFWDGKEGAVMATGALPENKTSSDPSSHLAKRSVPIFYPPPGTEPSDLAVGHDGVLYIALAPRGEIVMVDLRRRWNYVVLRADGFAAWRLAADPSGGVWVLDRANGKLGRVEGLPLPPRPYGPYSPNTFRPCAENANPPRLTIYPPATLPEADQETPIALDCSPVGQLALLSWKRKSPILHEPGYALIRLLSDEGEFGLPVQLSGASFPYSLTWVSENLIGLILDNVKNEALVYRVGSADGEELPVGDFYPLRDRRRVGGAFVNGVTLPPRYPTISGTTPLRRLSLPSFAKRGWAVGMLPLDSQNAQTDWHRLYVEASIPPNCGVKIYLAASGEETPPKWDDDQEWHEHRFGEIFMHSVGDRVPRAAWVAQSSEIPFNQGMLGCEPEKNRSGLFTVLIQRSNRRVRTLRGRYLHVRVALYGDGSTTPELAAVRAYASRFSYLNRYLPELYRETLFGPDADEIISTRENTTRPDFLERFLDNFEGLLTPLEDRIASAYLLTDPRSTNEQALEWLGSWIGMSFDPAYPKNRQRKLVEAAPDLYRRRGTYDGLRLALNIVTGGAIERREIVILEDFRLRRTFATILGADLADEDDPLLGGLAVSGNSYVGDTLFLGDEHRKEFLALFSANLPESPSEQSAIAALFDDLAHRVTVLVHEDLEPQMLALVRRVVELETPAHVLARVVPASFRFMVGMSSLVGIDTYLGESEPPQPVRVGKSNIGERDFILRPPSLDPRLEGGALEPIVMAQLRPHADAGPDITVALGKKFRLDASRSTAPPGLTIVTYIWRRTN
jgi:phage tail-like protein